MSVSTGGLESVPGNKAPGDETQDVRIRRGVCRGVGNNRGNFIVYVYCSHYHRLVYVYCSHYHRLVYVYCSHYH